MLRSLRSSFTLIELLLAVGIIGILSTVTIAAINPGRQFARARNSERWAEVNTIADAIQQHALDNAGAIASGIDTALRMLGTDAASCDVLCGEEAADPPLSGLGALWHLDESSGQIADSSGNGKNSTVVSGVTYGASGKFGTALSFDGNDYVDFPSVFPARGGLPQASGLDELTAMAWFRAPAPPPTTGVIVWEGWGGSFVLQMDTAGVVSFVVKQTKNNGTNYDGAWHGIGSSPATFADGAWHHIAGRYHRAGNTVRLSVDGATLGTYTGMSASEYLSYPPTNHPPIIGASSSISVPQRRNFFVGDIDEVILYGRALSDTEILALSQGDEKTSGACLDLSPALVSDYLTAIPADPRDGSDAKTHYAVKRRQNNRIEVRACAAELSVNIAVVQ